jgi:protein SCO1/2
MAERPAAPRRDDDPTRIFDGAFRLVAVLAAGVLVLMVLRLLADAGGAPGRGAAADPGASTTTPSPAASVDVNAYLEPVVTAAPPLELTGPDGQSMSLADFGGAPVLVFFGYTHCPDVCPATIGTVGLAIDEYTARGRRPCSSAWIPNATPSHGWPSSCGSCPTGSRP